MKRPAFQFYPADWRKDAALQSCSLSAQGLWINVLCIAHECDPYGHLTINGKAMASAQLARLVGLSAKECDALLAELTHAGVCSRSEDGGIFSRRMVRDEDLRNRRATGGSAGAEHGIKGAEAGLKGGRPKAGKGGYETPLGGDEKPPPSSSSSSSSSKQESWSAGAASATRGTRLPKDWRPDGEGLEHARKLGLVNGRCDAEIERFRDYWVAQPGQKGVKTDWAATWRNWARRASESLGKGGTTGTGDLYGGAL